MSVWIPRLDGQIVVHLIAAINRHIRQLPCLCALRVSAEAGLMATSQPNKLTETRFSLSLVMRVLPCATAPDLHFGKPQAFDSKFRTLEAF
jgi:hypothetical protein